MRLVIGHNALAVGLARNVAVEPAVDEAAQAVGHGDVAGGRGRRGDRRGGRRARGFHRFGGGSGGVLHRRHRADILGGRGRQQAGVGHRHRRVDILHVFLHGPGDADVTGGQGRQLAGVGHRHRGVDILRVLLRGRGAADVLGGRRRQLAGVGHGDRGVDRPVRPRLLGLPRSTGQHQGQPERRCGEETVKANAIHQGFSNALQCCSAGSDWPPWSPVF